MDHCLLQFQLYQYIHHYHHQDQHYFQCHRYHYLTIQKGRLGIDLRYHHIHHYLYHYLPHQEYHRCLYHYYRLDLLETYLLYR